MSRGREQPRVRCAIYTRKSTDERLSLEFNSIDAQRESAEAYIHSQKSKGWVCLPQRYDDGGFSGGNTDRPALQRLLADIKSGRIDCVVTYKVDRLSRSLLDFARLVDVFESHDVSFVCVTQQFDSSDSMGRLTLNILLSFAQFEREMVSERTRDKIAAARRKGHWSGGHPLLGYDIERSSRGSSLIVNEPEAERVRDIFEMYLQCGSLKATVAELNRRGWTTKQWETKAGQPRGGTPFSKTSLSSLLTNVTYLGKTRYHDEVYDGLHDAIVSDDLWQRVQEQLERHRTAGGASVRNKHNALLKGLLRCGACASPMGHSFSIKGKTLYRYYRCRGAERNGASTCPTKPVSAIDLERFVVAEISSIGRDPVLADQVLARCEELREERRQSLLQERKALGRAIGNDRRRLTKAGSSARAAISERITEAEHRVETIKAELKALAPGAMDRTHALRALREFDAVWAAMSPRDQRALLERLIDQIHYDAVAGTVRIAFRGDIPSAWLGAHQSQSGLEHVA